MILQILFLVFFTILIYVILIEIKTNKILFQKSLLFYQTMFLERTLFILTKNPKNTSTFLQKIFLLFHTIILFLKIFRNLLSKTLLFLPPLLLFFLSQNILILIQQQLLMILLLFLFTSQRSNLLISAKSKI